MELEVLDRSPTEEEFEQMLLFGRNFIRDSCFASLLLKCEIKLQERTEIGTTQHLCIIP